MRLSTDFHDFYDHWFDFNLAPLDTTIPVFERMAGERSLSRRQVLAAFDALDIATPAHGTVTEMVEKLRKKTLDLGFIGDNIEKMMDLGFGDMVVYLDEYAHRGEGKEKMGWRKALSEYPNHYATEYVPTHPAANTGISLRHLAIGKIRVLLRYTSNSDWRSNAGETKILPLIRATMPDDAPPTKFHYPLWAIDYLDTGKKPLAIDFNSAPQIRGTGLENILAPKEVVGHIEAWYAEHDPGRYINVPELQPETRCLACTAWEAVLS